MTGVQTCALPILIDQWPPLAGSFTVSLAIVAVPMLSALRPGALQAQSWRRLRSSWTKRRILVAIAVGGLSIVSATESLGLPRPLVDGSQLTPRTSAPLYMGFVGCLLVSHLVARGGQARAVWKNSFRPLPWFILAFGLAWVAKLGVYALYLHALLLTLQAALAPG